LIRRIFDRNDKLGQAHINAHMKHEVFINGNFLYF